MILADSGVVDTSTFDIIKNLAATMGTGGLTFVLIVLYLVNKERVAANKQLLDHLVTGDRANNRVAAALEGIVRKMDERQKSIVAAIRELQAGIKGATRRRGGR